MKNNQIYAILLIDGFIRLKCIESKNIVLNDVLLLFGVIA